MNVISGLVLDGVDDQFRNEIVHLAFLAVVGGIGIFSSVLTWLLRRDLKRRDDDACKMDLKVTAIEERVDSNDRRHGSELGDIRLKIVPLFIKAGIEPPNYPSR